MSGLDSAGPSASEPKHAPGPWRVGESRNVYGANPSARGLIAEVHGHVHTGERQANALLIAAAPDLMAALQRIVRAAGSGCTYSGDHPIALARAAIAKAEGCGIEGAR